MLTMVKYEFEVPEDVHNRLLKLQEQTELTTSELLISAAELVYRAPTQGVMKRIVRNIAARRFESVMLHFPAKTRTTKADDNVE